MKMAAFVHFAHYRRLYLSAARKFIAMCWITLAPKEGKGHKHHHHHHHKHHKHHHHHPHIPHPHLHLHDHESTYSSAEHLIRRDRISFDAPVPTTLHPSYDRARVRIITPTVSIPERPCHAHRHAHVHPLRLHPVKLHGPGKKRAPLPKAPPTSRNSSCAPSREPIYRIQPIYERREPDVEVRETTRIALREVRPERSRLRRVAGYEVLGKRVPWSWDCVSGTNSSVR